MGAKSKPQETLAAADVGGARRPRRRCSLCAAAVARRARAVEDNGARGRGDRRVPRREAAPVKTLVFLEHHEGALTRRRSGCCRRRRARRRGRRRRRRLGRRGWRRGRRVRCVDGVRRRRRAARRAAAAAAGRRARGARARRRVRHGSVRAVGAGRRHRRRASPPVSARGSTGISSISSCRRRAVGKRPALADTVCVDVGWARDAAPRAVPRRRVRPGRGRRHRGGAGRARSSWRSARRSRSWSSRRLPRSEGPSIEDADVIVAGGRGLGGPERFALVEELADALGGAVAATRAVVDAGWYPYSAQVGQTGKTVSPKLYVAVGISGAIQHKVGMQGSNGSSRSTRIRTRRSSSYADLGVVGDLNEIVPKLAELVRAAQGERQALRLPAALDRRQRRSPSRSDRRSDRGRRADRRGGAGGARGGDPARAARGGGPRGGRSGSARCRWLCSRRARRRARICSRAPSSIPGPLPGSARRSVRRDAVLRRGSGRGGAVPDEDAALRLPDAADDAQRGERGRVGVAARAWLAEEAEAARRRRSCRRPLLRRCSSRTAGSSACGRATRAAAARARSSGTSSPARTSALA